MGYHYQCSTAGFKKSCISNDTEIIRQLPETLQCEYTRYMTHRSRLSKTVGDLYRPYVQNSVGAKRFPDIIQNQQKITPFSSFNDRSKYAGHVLSPQYFCSFYTPFIREIRHLIDKEMEVLDGVYLKGDYTFKIIKLINKINGQPVFTALYTVLNKYEEV
ncbi:hypothetical protein INT45_012744 [Circinella minor]|uniref:Uncharacterized protein n=1 Tax=Circinella minor TaxID=1195481 RepID=A0A8H7S733_9FUNG|nr:hypothetical protein INT45_012744 [Circinella minor]